MKRNPLTVDGVTYPVSAVARLLSAHDPLTGAIVARGTTRGALVAEIRRASPCGQPCVEDTETLDRVIPRSSDQQVAPTPIDGATDKNGYVEWTEGGAALRNIERIISDAEVEQLFEAFRSFADQPFSSRQYDPVAAMNAYEAVRWPDGRPPPPVDAGALDPVFSLVPATDRTDRRFAPPDQHVTAVRLTTTEESP